MADLTIRFVGDTRQFSRAVKSVESESGRLGRSLGGVGRTVAGVFGGIAVAQGARALVGQFDEVMDEAEEARKVTALTNQVIKTTGGVANVTAGQVSQLAEAISNKTGIDDEQIQASSNLLLTFTKVRNEVGKGNDVFDQATRLATDMSVALGTDAKSASLQLGKALNDPIKGVSALTRAGVSFTAQQKEQIKTLVESGDILGAQKLILKEVGVQFGGAAEAAATPMQKLQVTIDNMKEKIGTALLPIVDKLATWLGENLPKAIAKLQEWWDSLSKTFKKEGISGVFKKIGENIAAAWPSIREKLGVLAQGVWDWIKENGPKIAAQLVEWGKAFVEWVLPQIPPMLEKLGQLLGKVGEWLLDEGLPLLVEKLKEWGIAFIKWVAPLIPPLLVELGKLGLRLTEWILTDALPKLVGKLAEWAGAFLGWIATDVLPELPGKLAELLGVIGSWVVDKGIPKLLELGGKLGGAIVDGLKALLSGALDFAVDIGKDIANSIIGFVNDRIIGGINDALEFKVGPVKINAPDIPPIPKLHTGGVFRADRAGGEGLALLRDGERVLSPAQSRADGFGGSVTVNIFANKVDGEDVVRELKNWQRRNGALPVKVA